MNVQSSRPNIKRIRGNGRRGGRFEQSKGSHIGTDTISLHVLRQGPNGTKYYLRVNPVETAPNRNGNEFTDNDDDGNGITRNENGHAEDETCPRNGLPLQLVDEKFVEKVDIYSVR